MKFYDTIVVGGGGAGLSAALTTAGFGKKTLLVEQNRLGGECTWTGCIPSKALIHLAKIAYSSSRSPPRDVFSQVDKVRQEVYSHENPEILAQKNVETLIGTARFNGINSIEVGGEFYRAKRFILASGSKSFVPPIPGLAQTDYLTSESFFQLEKLPESLLVMGAGSVGLEIAQASSRLGVKTSVVEMLPRILSREDADITQIIHRQLSLEGLKVWTNSRVKEVHTRESGAISLRVENDGEQQVLEAQSLLVAVGRRANIASLNLAMAGVKTQAQGIVVDKKLRSTNPRIYAAGDVVGPYAFSHLAEYQGVTAAMNALLPLKKNVDYRHVAWTTFTDPEIAHAGMREEEARERYGKRVRVYTHRYEDLDRGRTEPGTRGLVKIILGSRYHILGAHIVGPRAGEIIGEIQVLKTFGIRFHRLRHVIHPYPTYADILRQIAKKVALDRVLSHPIVRLGRFLLGKNSSQKIS